MFLCLRISLIVSVFLVVISWWFCLLLDLVCVWCALGFSSCARCCFFCD